ncbi:MAG: hypothetical protein M1839_007313 [Geoglossum umbratile]|nr:MAG: hypothetical protein M1839_007313 [Geoglossum umbratile]
MRVYNLSAAAAVVLLAVSPAVALPQGTGPSGDITPGQLIQIGKTTASCDGAQFPDECATAAEAAPLINAAFKKFNIATNQEKAALIALMMSETGEFKNNFRHDVVGQGTRNMQSINFNLQYALTFPELVPEVNAIRGDAGTPVTSLPPDAQNNIRALVLPNDKSFGSAMWFYTIQSDECKSEVRGGTEAGFEFYLAKCVITTVTTTATTLYANAIAALGTAAK